MLADDRLRLIRVKIERAYKHLDELEAAVLSLGEATFKTISIERQPEFTKPVLKADPLYIYGFDIPAIAGDIVHNLRCALDHLAFQLVSVGVEAGESRTEKWADIQFPIFHSPASYEAGKGRRIEGMRREAVEAIDRLKPYQDGNDALWLLRQLDNTDKHNFILISGQDVILAGIPLKTYEPYFTSLRVSNQKQDMNLPGEKPLIQPAVAISDALLPALHQLAELVGNIVTGFLPLLQDNAATPDTTLDTTLLPAEESERLEWPRLSDK